MSFQVGIGSLGGTVFFQVGRYIPLRTKQVKKKEKKVSPIHKKCLFLVHGRDFFSKKSWLVLKQFFFLFEQL